MEARATELTRFVSAGAEIRRNIKLWVRMCKIMFRGEIRRNRGGRRAVGQDGLAVETNRVWTRAYRGNAPGMSE
jgi:hypothetical protein